MPGPARPRPRHRSLGRADPPRRQGFWGSTSSGWSQSRADSAIPAERRAAAEWNWMQHRPQKSRPRHGQTPRPNPDAGESNPSRLPGPGCRRSPRGHDEAAGPGRGRTSLRSPLPMRARRSRWRHQNPWCRHRPAAPRRPRRRYPTPRPEPRPDPHNARTRVLCAWFAPSIGYMVSADTGVTREQRLPINVSWEGLKHGGGIT